MNKKYNNGYFISYSGIKTRHQHQPYLQVILNSESQKSLLMIKNIKNSIFELLSPDFSNHGFKLKKTKSLFTKKTANSELVFHLNMKAKYGKLSVSIILNVFPNLMNQQIQKDLMLDKNDTFCFLYLIPKEFYKIVEWKNDNYIRFYDGSLDIPEKDWLENRAMSLAEYLHPLERIKAGVQNILTIFHQVALPYFEKMDSPEYLTELLMEESLENLLDMIARKHTNGWKFLYMAKKYTPSEAALFKEKLLQFSTTEFGSEKNKAAFLDQLNLVV